MASLRTAVAQLGNVVGDIQGNAERVAEAMGWAARASADVLVLPELVLTGYPVTEVVELASPGAIEVARDGTVYATTGVFGPSGSVVTITP